MKAPVAPPPLASMRARTIELEEKRTAMFYTWRKMLEAARGNITHAAALMTPPISRNRANKLTRRFDLVEYAAALRIEATGRAMGTGITRKAKSKKRCVPQKGAI